LKRSPLFLADNILTIIAAKCMNNFPPHLSCFVTLIENVLWQPNMHVVFLWVGGSEKIKHDMRPTGNRRCSSRPTDWCVWGAPSCVNMRSPTRSHCLQYTQFICSWSAALRTHILTIELLRTQYVTHFSLSQQLLLLLQPWSWSINYNVAMTFINNNNNNNILRTTV